MRKGIMLLATLLLATSLATAGGRWTYKPEPRPVQFRFWLGAVINPEGVGPKADVEMRWGPRWGVKLGLGFPRVKDVGCARALFCPELHQVAAVNQSPHDRPTSPTVVEDTEQDWSIDLMFSWTVRQR